MAGSDPLFDAFMRAPEPAAPAAVERLLGAVEPAIRDVCAKTLGFDHAELEDACADAVARVLARVQRLREKESPEAIQNVAAYAAVTAKRTCADYLRRAHPVRARLACRVRYAMTHDPALRMRRGANGIAYAGLSRWADTLDTGPASLAAEAAASIDVNVSGAALLETVRALLARAGRWIELGALISALFDAAPLKDPAFTPAEDVDLPAPEPEDADVPLQARGRLEAAWREIAILPPRQRTALLLHLRDDQGRAGLPLFVMAGIATLGVLADGLGMAAAELADLWPSLPLDDLRIAERLGATRQQVINLRKSARARLGRRLADSSRPVVIAGQFPRQSIREHS